MAQAITTQPAKRSAFEKASVRSSPVRSSLAILGAIGRAEAGGDRAAMPTARALSAIDPETFQRLARHEMLRVSADGHALMTVLGSALLDRLSRKSLSPKSTSPKSASVTPASVRIPGAPTVRSPQ